MPSFFPRLRFPSYNIPLAEFKGHQVKALKRITQLAPQIDLVLEIRDSRAPLSTQNVLFDRALNSIPRVIIYLKKDSLALSLSLLSQWHQNEPYMFADCRSRQDAKNILQVARHQHLSMTPPPPLGLRTLIIGMPNVGKSTLVNTLRDVGLASEAGTKIGQKTKNRKVVKTGGMPGVTRSTSEIIRISRDPSVLLYDTPGVSLPRVVDSEHMIVLSLVGSIGPTAVDPVIQADYLLFLMNLQKPDGSMYRKYLKEPTNDVEKLLRSVAKTIGKDKVRLKYTGMTFDETGSAIYWVDRWRQGKEGRVIFDKLAIERYTRYMRELVDLKELKGKETERVGGLDIKMNREGLGAGKRKENVLFRQG